MLSVSRCAPAALFALLLCSCASRTPTTAMRDLSADALAARLEERDSRIASMTGSGSLSFESPAMAGSAYFDLSLKKPDSLLLTFEGPFGIGGGFLFLSRQKFVMYNSIENRVITGVPGGQAIRGIIPIDMTFAQIMDAFTGGVRLPAVAPSHSTTEEEMVRLEYDREGEGRRTYWVNPSVNLVVRFEVRDSAGAVVLETVSSRVTEQNAIAAPRRVTVRFPVQDQQLDIYYTSFEFNGGSPSFHYVIPANARTTIR